MAFVKAVNPTQSPTLVELDKGVATMSDRTTFTFPEGTKFTDQDPTQPPMVGHGKDAVRVEPKNGTAFYIIRGATLQTVLSAIEKCK